MLNNCIIIKPVTENSLDEFSEYILKDIIKEGYKDEEIIKEFTKRRNELKKATQKFNQDIDKQAKNINELPSFKDVFQEEDDK